MPQSVIRPDRARDLLDAARVFSSLSAFDPRFVGSIPLDVHGPDSDADIACGQIEPEAFKRALDAFSNRPGYTISDNVHCGEPSIIARFEIDGLPVEIYGRARPVEAHESYIHWLAEDRLLRLAQPQLRVDVRRLKAEGLKTEPAFAACLKLGDDPYVELLKLASPSEAALTRILDKAGYGRSR